jgi:hypothetical protein
MTTQLAPDRFDLPPPAEPARAAPLALTRDALTESEVDIDLHMDLADAGRDVGWITGRTVGFRGFADETEAAHAAWVAYRTLSRRLARTHGTRPLPIDTEPLAIQRRDDHVLILAAGRPIATLLRPGDESRSGPGSFGIEIRIPLPADALRVQALAYLMYRTLRKSGIRWALWRPGPAAADRRDRHTLRRRHR